MGARIAACLAAAGVTVCATSRHRQTLRSAAETIRAVLAETPAGRRPSGPADAEYAGDQILLTTDADAELARADLVIETIREDHGDKIALLSRIAALARPDAIITTNTSSLDLAALAGPVTGPQRFAGLHWFNPADLVELVEIVPAPATSAATIETLRAWMLGLGKSPVVLGTAVPGFIANRLQYALIREAYALVAAGVCTWADADLAVTSGLGPRWAAIGPFQSMDLAGLDVHLAVARVLYPVLAAGSGPPDLLTQLVAAGRLGAKSGAGLLGDYPPQRRAALAAQRDAMLRTIAQSRAPARPERETTGSEQAAGAVARKEAPDGSK
jgi:3-hydroxybutyryl-CoA dehydrogenase